MKLQDAPVVDLQQLCDDMGDDLTYAPSSSTYTRAAPGEPPKLNLCMDTPRALQNDDGLDLLLRHSRARAHCF